MAYKMIPSLIFVLCFTSVCIRVNCGGNGFSSKSLIPKRFWSNEDLVAEANHLVALGRYKEALPLYNRVIERKPTEKFDLYYLHRGHCYLGIGDCDAQAKAADDFQSAFSFHRKKGSDEGPPLLEESELVILAEELLLCGPHSYYCRSRAKWCYTEAIRLTLNEKEALSDLKKAFEMDSELEENHTSLKEVILRLQTFHDAAKELLPLLNDTVLLSLCKELKKTPKPNEAIYCFNEAIKREPGPEKLTEIYLDRAWCYLTIKQLERAISDYKNRVLLNLHDVNGCWYPFVDLLINNEKYNQFEDEIRVLSDEELQQLGHLFTTQTKYIHAIRVYSEAIKRDSTNKALYYKRRKDCYLKTGKKDEALSDLRNLIQQNPDDEEERLEYKMLLITDEKTKELVDMGIECMKTTKYESAIKLFDRALNKDTNCQICYEKRAYCYWMMKNYDNAISDLEKAVELAEWDVTLQIGLCEVLEDSKQYENKTRKILEQINGQLDESTSPIAVNRIKCIQAKMKY